jgi:hypothetical protein
MRYVDGYVTPVPETTRLRGDFAFRDVERFDRLFLRHRTLLLEDASHFLQEDAGERMAKSIQVSVREVSD